MKVLTKNVLIESKEFALISDTHEGKKFYGTIPYTELDEHGCMKRALNGLQMCISWNSPAEAIVNRTRDIKLDKLLARYTEQGLTIMEAFEAVVGTEEYEAIYA